MPRINLFETQISTGVATDSYSTTVTGTSARDLITTASDDQPQREVPHGQRLQRELRYAIDHAVLVPCWKRQGKVALHDPSLRVPFLIAVPGVPQGTRYDPITTVDLAPFRPDRF